MSHPLPASGFNNLTSSPSSQVASSPAELAKTLKREGRPYYPALDGLRALAFLLVFCSHYLNLPWAGFGVDIFFVLSGFLITNILVESRDAAHHVRNFYIRRTLRIFPLYYLTLLIVFFIAWLTHMNMSRTLIVWPIFLGNWLETLYTVPQSLLAFNVAHARAALILPLTPWLGLGISHFWSLCVEEQFYLVWPFIVFKVRNRLGLLSICLSLIVICPLGRAIIYHLHPLWADQSYFLYRATPMRLDAFMLGGLLALWERGRSLRWLRHCANMCLAAGIVLITVTIAPHLPQAILHHNYTYPSWEYTWGLIIVDLLCFSLLVEALQPGSLVYRLLNLSSMRWLGRISYGAYVFHFIPMAFYFEFIRHLPIQHKLFPSAVMAFCITIFLAWLSFRFFESPILRLKERWAS